jgi:glycerol-1-phosphatase
MLDQHPEVTPVEGAWRCGGWQADATAEVLTLRSTGPDREPGDGLDGLRALAVAHWARHPEEGRPALVRAGDEASTTVLAGWGLTPG